MSSTKKRDLAKELADFLASEEGKRTSPDQKTAALPNETMMEFELRVPQGEPVEVNPTSSWQKNQSSKAVLTGTLAGQAEAMRVVQGRIQELEKERDQLRDQNEQLLTATETLQRKLAEARALLDNNSTHSGEKIEILEEEKAVLRARLQSRESEIADLKKENEELKLRFQSDLRKVRVRERELENRLELLRAEQSAVARAKDESLLSLRQKMDQLEYELENFRAKASEMNSELDENHERNHRMVKALRLALSMLEGADQNEEQPTSLKKVSG